MPASHVQPRDLVEHTARLRREPRRAWLRRWLSHATAAALAVGLGLGPVPAAEPAREFEFDLPAGRLGATLLHIGEISHAIVSFQPATVERHRAPAIQGRFTLLHALVSATQSSGLVVEITPSGSATVLPRAKTLGAPCQDDRLRGGSATRSDTPLSDLSQAVSVLTPDALSLLSSSSVLDAASFVLGASASLIPLGDVEKSDLTGIAVGR